MRHAFWVDRGGTFTDCIHHDRETGRHAVLKVLSSDRAPLVGIRKLLGIGESETIPPCEVRMGTTVATNALLERRGAPCALAITRGFGDVLRIGDQTRSNLFDLRIEKRAALYRSVVEVDARCSADGAVLHRDDPKQLERQLLRIREMGVDSLAVVVLHAYRGGALELDIENVARSVGFRHVALSHQVASRLGLLSRTGTTVLDAYLTPLLAGYLDAIERELPGSRLRLMQSSGGLVESASFRGPNALLSGPAGGVVASAEVARQAGVSQVIGFDMGGTSTDVSRFAGRHELVYEQTLAGIEVTAPSMDIHTVAAGGGSICSFDGQRFRVGPESAGADPGPLCYGRANAQHLTVTDLNLVLGRLPPDLFPFELDPHRPRAKLEAMRASLPGRWRHASVEAIAQGMLEIANANMADAVAQVSVARGFDPKDHALVVFGGAAGQHACAVADLLGIETLVFHPFSGVLSAYGMGLAPCTRHVQRDAGHQPLGAAALEAAHEQLLELGKRAQRLLHLEGFADAQITLREQLSLSYAGAEATLTLDWDEESQLRSRFERTHERVFGYRREAHPIVIAALRVSAESIQTQPLPIPSEGATSGERPDPLCTIPLWGRTTTPVPAPVYQRSHLRPGPKLFGPCVVVEGTSALVVDIGFELHVRERGLLVAQRVTRKHDTTRKPATEVTAAANGSASHDTTADPVLLELLGNRLMSIAKQMGHVLQRTALSTNIRDRLDYSCAVFTRRAELVANAPHVPVHLGAMGESVRAVAKRHPNPQVGDVFVINDPDMGGSHLPDITVIAPVHDENGRLAFFVANRGHHADVGGITPGSMPASSTTLAEEGVVFRGEQLVTEGVFQEARIRRRLADGPWPARAPDDNVADLLAQVAANRRGVELLLELCAQRSAHLIERYMDHILDYSESRVRALIAQLPPGARACQDKLDDGTPIAVQLRVANGQLEVDFTGSGPEHPGNLNAPRAVTLSAVLYVLRCLLSEQLPLNDGCLRPVAVQVPPRSLLHPAPGRAVAAGNVETSQRVVDVLLGAFHQLAASQGTMNNVCFGNATLGYYETIAGGAGAGPTFSGADAVHTHMTNTRITDSEVLERRFPVRVREFSVRHGSGGDGRHRGGDGVVRELEFLQPLELSVVSERRATQPFGLSGGSAGAPGQNRLNGKLLPGRIEQRVGPGDRLRIETPGGGAYGPSVRSASSR